MTTFRRGLPLGTLITLVACAGQPTASKRPATPTNTGTLASTPMPKVVRTQVFTAPPGLLVEVVVLEDQKALIRLTGSRSELEGKVLEYTIVAGWAKKESRFFQTKLHGSKVDILAYVKSRGMRSWRLKLPERRMTKLKLDKEKSAALDARSLFVTHQRQKAAGELALQRFERAWEERRQQKLLDRVLASMREECGHRPQVALDWKAIDDRVLLEEQPGSDCANIIESVQRCGKQTPRIKAFWRTISTIRCLYGDARSIERAGRELRVTMVKGKPPRSRGQWRAALARLPATPTMLMAEAEELDGAYGCIQGKRLIIVLPRTVRRGYPKRARPGGIYYGTKQRLVYVKGRPRLLDGAFYDPRYRRQHTTERGRYNQLVSVRRGEERCNLNCGTQNKQLERATPAQIEATLRGATIVPAPHQRRPHALARDRRGVYYYVDRGLGRARSEDYRVYVGKRGRMTRQKMVDVVSDSEGEIFQTKRGKLRLIFGKREALWITKRRAVKLTQVPVKKNLKMIYTELGVYLGKRLGTPCDDF